MKNLCKIFLLVVIAAFYASVAWSDEAMVIEVIDGDTILIQENGRNREVGIKGIDAPELSQPFGVAAKEALQKIILNKNVYIDYESKVNGRTVAYVFEQDKNRPVSWNLLENGLAWCANRSDRDNSLNNHALQQDSMCNAELQARQKKLGLWSQPNKPPWIWQLKSESSYAKNPTNTKQSIEILRASIELEMINNEKDQAMAQALAQAQAEYDLSHPEEAALRRIEDQNRQLAEQSSQQNRILNNNLQQIQNNQQIIEYDLYRLRSRPAFRPY